MFVKPNPGEMVPDPEALPPMPRWLPEEGRDVPDNAYWRGLVRDGSVQLADPPAEAPTAQAEPEQPARRAAKPKE